MQSLAKQIGLEGFRYSPWQFAIFRIILGSYLFIHFLHLVPYAPELFSNVGLVPEPQLQATYSIFPNLILHFNTSIGVTAFVIVLAILSVFLIIGFQRPLICVLLWYGWACLFNCNLFINNPGLSMVGWTLLAMAIVPRGEPLSVYPRKQDWYFPNILFWGAWLIAGIAYSVSGLHKFASSPSWHDGTAIGQLLLNPLARDTILREWLLHSPVEFVKIQTYSALLLETLFFPLILFQRTRRVAWFAVIGMHLGIMAMVDFADLTLGVVMFHLFTFDARFIKPAKVKEKLILFFDGVCGLCNSTVDLIMEEEQTSQFSFSPLQSKFAKDNLPAELTTNFSSLVLLSGEKIFTKSDAVLEMVKYLGGIWSLAVVFRVVPKFLRDKIYNIVAARRYQWFGKKETCRLPTKEERDRFY